MPGPTKMLPVKMWAAIRRSTKTGRESIDPGTIQPFAAGAKRNAEAADAMLPTWGKDHPVVRVAEVTIFVTED